MDLIILLVVFNRLQRLWDEEVVHKGLEKASLINAFFRFQRTRLILSVVVGILAMVAVFFGPVSQQSQLLLLSGRLLLVTLNHREKLGQNTHNCERVTSSGYNHHTWLKVEESLIFSLLLFFFYKIWILQKPISLFSQLLPTSVRHGFARSQSAAVSFTFPLPETNSLEQLCTEPLVRGALFQFDVLFCMLGPGILMGTLNKEKKGKKRLIH